MSVLYFAAGMANACLIVVMFEMRSIGRDVRKAIKALEEEEAG